MEHEITQFLYLYMPIYTRVKSSSIITSLAVLCTYPVINRVTCAAEKLRCFHSVWIDSAVSEINTKLQHLVYRLEHTDTISLIWSTSTTS